MGKALARSGVVKFIAMVLFGVLACSTCYAGLRILGEDSPPGEYLDQKGNPAGVTIELVKILLKRQDKVAAIEILPWSRAYYLGLHARNIALLETTRTAEREALFKWVGPILVVKRILYATAEFDRQVADVSDIRRKDSVCVLRGSSNESYLRKLDMAHIYPVTKPFQCIEMLFAGHADLFYTSEIGMNGLLKERTIDPGRFKPVLNLTKEYLYIAFSKDVDDNRIRQWQAALEEVKRDGTLAGIYAGVYPDSMIREVCLPGDPLSRR